MVALKQSFWIWGSPTINSANLCSMALPQCSPAPGMTTTQEQGRVGEDHQDGMEGDRGMNSPAGCKRGHAERGARGQGTNLPGRRTVLKAPLHRSVWVARTTGPDRLEPFSRAPLLPSFDPSRASTSTRRGTSC